MAALFQTSNFLAGDNCARSPSINSRFRYSHVDRGRTSAKAASQVAEETASTSGRTGKDKPDWTGLMPCNLAKPLTLHESSLELFHKIVESP